MSYDPGADVLDLRFADAPVAQTEQVRPGVTIDLDAQGRIVGIDVVEASQRLNKNATLVLGAKAECEAPAMPERKRIDVAALRALTATMPMQAESASTFIRAMRDSDRY